VPPRFLIDPTPLRSSPDFRRLFVGQTVSMIGTQLTVMAIAYQVYSLTHSSLQVGAVSMTQLVPFVAGTLAGGTIGDAVDRKRVLVVTSLLLAVTSGGLAVNALADRHTSVVVIYIVTGCAAGLSGVVSTATTGAVPSLVTADQLTPAYATMQVIDQVGMVIGPATAGLLIAATGLPWLYGIDALTFLWTAAFFGRMAKARPVGATARPKLHSVLEGLHYVRGRPELTGAYLIDLFATVFGLPRALFPALARTVFHGGPVTLGFLYAAPAAGALVSSLTSGWLTGIRRQGRAVILAVLAWGALIVVFGFVHLLSADLVLLAAAGGADVISAVLRSTIVQTAVTDPFRSRVSSVQMAVVEGGPRLGDLESGGVATAVSPTFSIVSGGLVCMAGAVAVALLLPAFRRFGQPLSES
jgi:hypothetical protein